MDGRVTANESGRNGPPKRGLGVGPTTSPRKKKPVMKPQDMPRNGREKVRRPGKLTKDNEFRLFTWNVRTLHRPGALKVLTDTLESYKADVTAIQEMRWIGSKIIQKLNCDVYYSCHKDKHIFGTGFIVSKRCKHIVLDFKPVNERICRIRLKGKFFNTSIINAHAPTEDKTDDIKEDFYDVLGRTYDQCPANDIKIIIGDLNAKIGREDAFGKTIGRHSLHEDSNDNGVRAVMFAASRNMVVCGTLFDHKNIHKWTWTSPNGKTSNQIDHVLIDARHVGNVMDTRSYRGANIDSDHYLVGTKIRSRISNAKKESGTRQQRYDTNRLKDNKIAESYIETIASKLVEDQIHDEDNPEDQWKRCKAIVETTAEKVLGFCKPTPRNGWFDRDCEEVTARKNEAYKALLQKHRTRTATEAYKIRRREEKHVHRAKKRAFENNRVEEIVAAKGRNDSRQFYQKINNVRNEFKPRITMCRDKSGNIINDKAGILGRWAEHFEDLLNQTTEPEVEQAIQIGESETPQETPSLEETKKAIKRLKNNKSPGSDSLPSELFKYGGDALVAEIHMLMVKVWNLEVMPQEWKIGLICPLHKKGSQLECANYRGITLLNVVYKIFSNILAARITPLAERIIGRYQCGFRPGRSTTDQIFALRQIIEKAYEWDIETHHVFIDFKTAYDSVKRVELYNAMQNLGIPNKLIRLTMMTMKNSVCAIKIQSDISNQFPSATGVRQGDALSCTLFNLVLEKVIRDAKVQTTGTIFMKSSQLLGYADDIDIIGRNVLDAKESFIGIETAAARMGLRVNEAKTKYMVTASTKHATRLGQNLTVDDYNFEVVGEFVYLGSTVTSQNNISHEIQRRIVSANRCFYGLRKILSSRNLTRRSKLTIYKTLILPVAMFGSETWTMSKKDESQLGVFERKIFRWILGPVREDGLWRRRYNFELYQQMEDADIVSKIKVGRLRWAGHVSRWPADNPAKKVYTAKPAGTRRPGRPKLRWVDGVSEDAKKLGIRRWSAVAQDRKVWRQKLEEAKTRTGL